MKRSKPIRRKAVAKPRRGERASKRFDILHRAFGKCERCGEPILSNSWEDHHIFFKSRHFFGTIRTMRDEIWNRCALHDSCHDRIHNRGDVEGRALLERLALSRLEARVGPVAWRELQLDARGTSPSAIVEAYERRGRRTLANVVDEPENSLVINRGDGL